MSDWGPQFTSRVWVRFMEKLWISMSLTSGYHLQENAQVERDNQEVRRFLRAYCSSNQEDWARFLLSAKYAQNSLRHSETQLTKFQCVLGCQPSLYPWNANLIEAPAVDEWVKWSKQVRPINTRKLLSNAPRNLLIITGVTLQASGWVIECGWPHMSLRITRVPARLTQNTLAGIK